MTNTTKNEKQELIEHIKKSLENYDNGNGYALPNFYEGKGLAIDIFPAEKLQALTAWRNKSTKTEEDKDSDEQILFLDPASFDEDFTRLLQDAWKEAMARFNEIKIILKEISAETFNRTLFVQHESDTRLTIKPNSDTPSKPPLYKSHTVFGKEEMTIEKYPIPEAETPFSIPPAYIPRYRIVIKPEHVEKLRRGLNNRQQYKNTDSYYILKALQEYNRDPKTHYDASGFLTRGKFLDDPKALFISGISNDDVKTYDHLSVEEIDALARKRALEIGARIKKITGDKKGSVFLVRHEADKRFTNKILYPTRYGIAVSKDVRFALAKHCMYRRTCINTIEEFVVNIAKQTEEPKKVQDIYKTKKGELLDQDISLEEKANILLTFTEKMVTTLKPKITETTASKIRGVFKKPLTIPEQFEKFKEQYTKDFPAVVAAEKAEKVEAGLEIKGTI